MKFNFSPKWCIIILSITLNLLFFPSLADNSRTKKHVRFENVETISDYEDNVDNDESEQNDLQDDYKNIDVIRKGIPSEIDEDENENDDNLSLEPQNIDRVVKRTADINLPQYESEKVEKNVENDIYNLKHFYKPAKIGGKLLYRDTNNKISSSPNIVRISVRSLEPNNKLSLNRLNINERKNRAPFLRLTGSYHNLKIARQNVSEITMTPLILPQEINTVKQNFDVKKVEKAIDDKINAIAKKVKYKFAKEQKHKKFKKLNVKHDEVEKNNHDETFSPTIRQSLKSSLNNRQHLESKRSEKNVNHHEERKSKKSIPKLQSDNQNESSVRLDSQLSSLKSEGLGNQLTRSLTKSRENSQILHRFSRRFRKLPKTVLSLLENNKKKRGDVKTAQNVSTNSNFLFHRKFKNKKVSFHEEQMAPHQNQRKKKRDLKGKRDISNNLMNHRELRSRRERNVKSLFNKKNLESPVDSNGLNNVPNSYDANSQLLSGYNEAFGGYPNDSDDTSLVRYKRIK